MTRKGPNRWIKHRSGRRKLHGLLMPSGSARRLLPSPRFRSSSEKDEDAKRKAPYKDLGADSEEKHEPVSNIDTVVVDSPKALDPKRPIREADINLNALEARV